MALQQLSLGPNPVDGVNNGVEIRPMSSDGGGGGGGGGGEDGSKTPRLPRWTRQEILVLIQGKKVAESRVRGGRAASLAFGVGVGVGVGQVEPKWASVSSYCKRHGVNRGPVQCRKRWSNLAGDFKKIKEWETQIRDDTDSSFWVMRNDLRRERKLPGFFDKEVYDILESGSATSHSPAPALALALAPIPTPSLTPNSEDVKTEFETETETEAEAEAEHVFDSSKTAAADDGLFSDFEQDETETSRSPIPIPIPIPLPAPTPLSEKLYEAVVQGCQDQGTSNEKQAAAPNPEIGSTSQEGRKRKRLASDGDEETIMQDQLIGILEKNGKMLTAQLEAQNVNFQLDREQRRNHGDGLVAVLNKLADALGRIADKL